MEKIFTKISNGYQNFRQKYAAGDDSMLQQLAEHGQKPEIMVVACCDSRVDPALLLQCEPGDLFTVRNVANIIPPYEADEHHHGTSAALEFGICYLNIKHLIILGHSQCGGINAAIHNDTLHQDDFISNWVSLVKNEKSLKDTDALAQHSLNHSYENCFTFPWIKERVIQRQLAIHRWFFAIKSGEIFAYSDAEKAYVPLNHATL